MTDEDLTIAKWRAEYDREERARLADEYQTHLAADRAEALRTVARCLLAVGVSLILWAALIGGVLAILRALP